jgi:hypothetical protein
MLLQKLLNEQEETKGDTPPSKHKTKRGSPSHQKPQND